MTILIQTSAFDPLYEFVPMIDVEDKNPMPAIFQIITNAGRWRHKASCCSPDFKFGGFGGSPFELKVSMSPSELANRPQAND